MEEKLKELTKLYEKTFDWDVMTLLNVYMC